MLYSIWRLLRAKKMSLPDTFKIYSYMFDSGYYATSAGFASICSLYLEISFYQLLEMEYKCARNTKSIHTNGQIFAKEDPSESVLSSRGREYVETKYTGQKITCGQ